MNVHFSYRFSKSPEVEHEVQNQVQKLGKRLQAFRPELVHLHGGFEKNSGREDLLVSLNLRLPSGQLTAQEIGANGVAALKAAFHDLTAQLNTHKQLLRNRYKWRRNTKEKRSVPFEDTLAAIRPSTATDSDIHSFINANIAKLSEFIGRELRYREESGLLPPNTLTREEVLDEVVAAALGAEEERPGALGLEAWLYKLARNVMLSAADGVDGEPNAIHFEEPVGIANVSGSDEEYFQFHQPDDYLDEESIIPDQSNGTPEQTMASDEFISQLESVLKNTSPQAREAFILFAIEGFTIDEIARISDKNGDDVRNFIETAKDLIGKKLQGNGNLKEKLLKKKLA